MIALCSLGDSVRLEHHVPRQSDETADFRILRLIDGHPSVAHGGLCGFAELLRTNLLQFLVLLR